MIGETSRKAGQRRRPCQVGIAEMTNQLETLYPLGVKKHAVGQQVIKACTEISVDVADICVLIIERALNQDCACIIARVRIDRRNRSDAAQRESTNDRLLARMHCLNLRTDESNIMNDGLYSPISHDRAINRVALTRSWRDSLR